ncbi:MAG: hypothetical protein ACYDHT_03290 [Solirubrobacteraceae bacterium]
MPSHCLPHHDQQPGRGRSFEHDLLPTIASGYACAGRSQARSCAIAAVRLHGDKRRDKRRLPTVTDPRDAQSQSPDVAREISRLRREAAQATEHSKHSAARVIDVEQTLAELQARIFVLEESRATQKSQLDDLQQRLVRADDVARAMHASLSWRLTAPLRALKRIR